MYKAYYLFSDDSLGVIKKINAQVMAVDQYYDSVELIKADSFSKMCQMIKYAQENDLIFIRYFTRLIFLYPWLKKSKAKIILEIPTPIANLVYECEYGVKFLFRKILFKISFPRLFNTATQIIEYAEEDSIYIGNNNDKINLITNGVNNDYYINWNEFFEKKKNFNKNNSIINVLVVANLGPWHGVDRFITSMIEYYKTNQDHQVVLHIVGGGVEKSNLERIVNENNLGEIVKFYGQKKDNELVEYYQFADFALGSLGLSRKGLKTASILKVREYCLYGIPFVIDYPDQDFINQNFVYNVEYGESEISLSQIIQWYLNLKQDDKLYEIMHRFAINNLSWKAKLSPVIRNILGGIN